MSLTLRRQIGVTLAVLGALTVRSAAQEVSSRRGVVVSTSNYASDIGAAILSRGGNAIDAAVATGFALAVTHPAAGNIGGGGFMVIRLADGRATTVDYREKAPGAATPTMYVNAKGEIDRSLTANGWLAPGVPGTVRGLALAHAKYGKLPWSAVVQPAADLARDGFRVSSGFARSLNGALRTAFRPHSASVRAYGKTGGGEWTEGDTLRLPDLARSLDAIAHEGPDAFYKGWIADSIAVQMKAHGGIITKADLANYSAVERAPIRGTFMGHELIGMPPPSSGGIVMVEVLNQLERLNIGTTAGTAEYLHARIEATRRAYLDRAKWLGDPDFVKIPVARLTSKGYADTLVRGISKDRATSSLELGKEIVTASESEETTHFSVVDADGNAVSNTYTLEGGYGSGVVVHGAGFILNNEMGDFNKKPGETNTRGDIGTAPNLIAPGKRMLSSMSPVIVTKGGQLRLVTGSPGGRTIPNTVLNVVLGVVAFGLSAQAAVDLPRMHQQWLPDVTSFEAGVADETVIARLKGMGHTLDVRTGLGQGDAHSILYDAKSRTAYGAADKRSPDSKASVPR